MSTFNDRHIQPSATREFGKAARHSVAIFAVVACSLWLVACGGGSDSPVVSTTPPPIPPVVKNFEVPTMDGMLLGIEERGSKAFKGVPYASPPVGELRWQPPQPIQGWSGVRDADQFGSKCFQPEQLAVDVSDSAAVNTVGSEDCLYLNVWTPLDASEDDALPVMVFSHGGADLFGSGHESMDILMNTNEGPPVYDGSRMAARADVIVITLNYRLGTLGFLAHPSLLGQSLNGYVGNYGLLDQIAALQWVQDNIDNFGGDPDKVMYFGQSGGAYNVCTLMASPLAAGLFSRAAMHSGSCGILPEAVAETNAQVLVDGLGCAGSDDQIASCLRAKTGTELTLAEGAQPNGLGSFNMFPHVDGYVAPVSPLQALTLGNHNHMPFLVGSNSEEYSTRFQGLQDAAYLNILSGLVGNNDDLNIAMTLYPLSDFESPNEAVVAFYSDRNIVCGARRFASTVASVQIEPVYRYHFTREMSSALRAGPGAYHGSELVFLFQHMSGDAFSANDDDRVVEQSILSYWVNFADSGDPNGNDLPSWPRYDPALDPYMKIDVTSTVENELSKSRCDFWTNVATQLN